MSRLVVTAEPTGHTYAIGSTSCRIFEERFVVAGGGVVVIEGAIVRQGTVAVAVLHRVEKSRGNDSVLVDTLLGALIGAFADVTGIKVVSEDQTFTSALSLAIEGEMEEDGAFAVDRKQLMSCSRLFLASGSSEGPTRDERGYVYSRYIAHLKSVFSLRLFSLEQDLDRFHEWMNNPRVAEFWQEAGPKNRQDEYARKALADPHATPLIACLDDWPFAYFEAYWAKEDKLAAYYDAFEFDRGIHVLIGEERLRGPHRVAGWLPSVVHYLYLDDPRTERVVAEPRHDNVRMIKYFERHGFEKGKAFDFPHKRAVLMMSLRRSFFASHLPSRLSHACTIC